MDVCRHLAGVHAFEPAQRILVVAVAGTEHGHLDAACQDTLERVGDEVHSFLPGQARNHDHQRAVIADLEPQLFLNRRLAGSLAAHILGGERRGDARIACGVVLLDVDAVHDAREHVLAASQRLV